MGSQLRQQNENRVFCNVFVYVTLAYVFNVSIVTVLNSNVFLL